RRRQDHRAEADAARGVLRLRSPQQRPDAALSEGGALGRGPRRHPRLSAIDSCGEGLQKHSASQSVGTESASTSATPRSFYCSAYAASTRTLALGRRQVNIIKTQKQALARTRRGLRTDRGVQ